MKDLRHDAHIFCAARATWGRAPRFVRAKGDLGIWAGCWLLLVQMVSSWNTWARLQRSIVSCSMVTIGNSAMFLLEMFTEDKESSVWDAQWPARCSSLTQIFRAIPGHQSVHQRKAGVDGVIPQGSWLSRAAWEVGSRGVPHTNYH